jgi:putative nucleotidyltransferase with HDIG domain
MREEALELLKKYTKSDSLIKHAFAVEAGMRAYAKKYGADEDRWAAVGLLHDVDYEMYPEEHPLKGVEILEAAGYDDAFVKAVKAHADYTGTERDSQMAKVLYAVDEFASFIVTVALVRPTKLEGMKYKSVKKKFKSKAFAEAIDRDHLEKSVEELGEDFVDHVNLLINELQNHEAYLNERGYSLVE